jgi:hypothetical protein
MNKLHAPHKNSGYIASVEFEPTTDQFGNPDWSMLYTPGPKARAEFRAFDKKGGPRTLVVEQSLPALDVAPRQVEHSPLELELIARGVRADVAVEFAASRPEESAAQIEHFDWLKANDPKKIKKSDGGFLSEAIRKSYPTPKGFESKADREKRVAEERAQQAQELQARRRKEAEEGRREALRARVASRWEGMTAGERAACEAAALDLLDDDHRRTYENYPSKFKGHMLRSIRDEFLTRLIEQEEAGSR